jgi:glycosyltransferase involved in cell wall biosynthesis
MDFEWIIVDDGSTDNTKGYIEGLLASSNFPIRYIYKDNGGKHTALNAGTALIETQLTIIVDSDDILLPNAVELIDFYYQKYKDDCRIGVLSFLRCDKKGQPIVHLDREEYVGSYLKYRIRENRHGDMAEVFYTSVLKEFPFPEFGNERFLSEDVVWILIGL